MQKSIRKAQCYTAQLVLLLMLLVVPGNAHAQAGDARADGALDPVEKAFAQGNARTLLSDAADRIEITMFGRSTLYSRAQATYVMEEFFREYPPDSFSLDTSSATGGSRFATGRYRSEQAEQPLHIYIRLRQKRTEWELREIRIEQMAR